MLPRPVRLFLLSGSATLIALIAAMSAMEIWVRANWNPLNGTPGLFIADARRSQRLAPGYTGWFAGVPVSVNRLGFRDTREWPLEKGPRSFRILVLGDSVTFGHGSVYETTYPYLLEQRLKQWRSDIDWQVWNLGVPGYNTGQELSQLLELGPRYSPDLVVVGFYENDFNGNETDEEPGRITQVATAIRNEMETHLYSTQWYKRVFLTIAWRLSRRNAFHDRLDNLAAIEAMTKAGGETASQRLTHPTPRPSSPEPCPPGVNGESERQARLLTGELERTNRWAGWTRAVQGFADLHRTSRYRVVFFLNLAPDVMEAEDLFCDGGSRRLNDYLVARIGAQVPVVSAYDDIGRYRPSEMPLAKGHSIGNTNAVKAGVLFDYVRRLSVPSPTGG